MTIWDTLWRQAPEGLLLDSNDDGLSDGVAACLVPVNPERFTPEVWSGAANLAARLGLETPAIHLPITCEPDTVELWQTPVLIAVGQVDRPPSTSGWATAQPGTVLLAGAMTRVEWLLQDNRRALWVHGSTTASLAALLNEMACAGQWATRLATGLPATRSQNPHRLDLAQLLTAVAEGLLVAQGDGHTPDDVRCHLVLGPATDTAAGLSAINLAARLGLETAGLSLPMALTETDAAAAASAEWQLLLGFPLEQPQRLAVDSAAWSLQLSPQTATYLALHYPYLRPSAHQTSDEESTVGAIMRVVRDLVHAHSTRVKLAVAETQVGHHLPELLAGLEEGKDLRRVVFRREWNPPDGHDDLTRVRQAYQEMVLPAMARLASTPGLASATATLFCNAPPAARQRLAAQVAVLNAAADIAVQVRVLPAHKAGLTWLLDEQAPLLAGRPISRVELGCLEFRPPTPKAHWVDLPTRWLQELFPADELLQRQLGLAADQVELVLLPAETPLDPACVGQIPVYRLTAYDNRGACVHKAELHLLWDERQYMAGLPAYGLVHPMTAGIVLILPDGQRQAWPVPTDCHLFWDFFQDEVLPALRDHVLEAGRGRPTPENEPYFDLLEIDGAFGWPDEPLGVYEEFISVGEALHEDLYFNTLDYLAALGESFSGRAIDAAGQVLPFIHDYFEESGSPIVATAPRATVTLHAPPVPRFLPEIGFTVGDRRDMPVPQSLCVQQINLDPAGQVSQVTVSAQYAGPKSAQFAARVLDRWRELADGDSGFPVGVAIDIACSSGSTVLATVAVPARTALTVAADHADAEAAATPFDSDVIGPVQLKAELEALAALPGVRVWQVGRSYQGRPVQAVDVTLPVHPGQTHVARLKQGVQKPTCLIVARHHANEVSSTTAALELARDLSSSGELHAWLNKVNLVFLPMENPDGAAVHYRLMAEHPSWKHHAARYNAAGKDFSMDFFAPATPFGEARVRPEVWARWLPDAIVDNHGVPSHEWCQPFAGYNTPPRFPVSYHVVQAMIYGIVMYPADPALAPLQTAAHALREAVTTAVAATPWLQARNQYWLSRYRAYGHQWLPEVSPVDEHNGMLFFYNTSRADAQSGWRRNYAMRFPTITLLDWITEVPDETAQGEYLKECAAAHRVANLAMIRLVADSAALMEQVGWQMPNGRTRIRLQRLRRIGPVIPDRE